MHEHNFTIRCSRSLNHFNLLFFQVNALAHLDLEDNLMGKIPFGPISHVKTLKVLDLSKNRVEKVEDPFFTIEQLKLDRLYLMDNNIETLPTNSFANFEFINYTTLSGNPLRIIEEEAFKAKIQIIKFSEHERVVIHIDY